MKKIKLILTTLCCLVGLGCFCFSTTLDNGNFPGEYEFQTSTFDGTRNLKQYYGYNHEGVSCVFIGSNGGTFYDGTNTYNMSIYQTYCTTSETVEIRHSGTTTYWYVFLGKEFISQFYPNYTSLECQTQYNLIPISSVDQTYCTTNNLCPSSGGGDCTGSDWSALYINGVQHDSAGIIDIDISEDISWDYNLTGSQFNLDIVGYNVDYEKINEIVSIQEYKPSSKDFTQVVGALVPYIKILVFLLFAFIIIKRLKKPFSSKLK